MKFGHIVLIGILVYILYKLYDSSYGKGAKEKEIVDEAFNGRVATLKQAWLDNSGAWCDSFTGINGIGLKASCHEKRLELLKTIDFSAMQRQLDSGSDAMWQQYGANVWFPR